MTRRRRRAGYELPLLLVAAFRSIIDELHGELAGVGHPDARPVHGFALQAIGDEGATISELGRRLGISKQAAAKTAAGLEQLGYATRVPDSQDGRAVQLRRTARGNEFLGVSAAVFERIQRRWDRALGASRVAELEDTLAQVVGDRELARLGDLPGWLR
jgi:DNA-binding MarR family transcriptional regulator